jgi:rhodanese-related sulfurtransferase
VFLITIVVGLVALCSLILVRIKRTRERQVLEQHSITPEALHALLTSDHEVLLFDVRQPLDLLVDSEIIPGAKRVPPREIIENPSLIPKDKDSVAYCTCPGDRSSRAVTYRALAMHFDRVKFLKGGLAAWQSKGYPVDPYQESFHLDNAT